MKKSTKIITLILVLCMALALCSCGGSKTAETGSAKLKILDTAYAEEDYAICIAKENTELLEKVDGALGELIADGTTQKVIDKYISGVEHDLSIQANVAADAPELHMATNANFPPYEYHENEEVLGIDAEIAGLIADKLGMKLVIDDMEFGAIIIAVQTGKSDMGMAGMTVTEERKEQVNFTQSYAKGVQVVIVPENSAIASVDDLFAEGAKHNIGVQISTTGDLYATWDLEDAGLATIQRYNKAADAIEALCSGKIDCVILDNEPAKAFVAQKNS